MRVISGEAKGRTLKSVKGREVRPTADRVKESMFNVLSPRVAGARFLDLFAGAGAIGIEALSRGAESCTFVELVTGHLKLVEENLAATGLLPRSELLRRDARAALADLGRRGVSYDLIFVDPPYGQGLVNEALAGIVQHNLLTEDGWVICEHHKKDLVQDTVSGAAPAGGLCKFRELIFGESVLSFFAGKRPS